MTELERLRELVRKRRGAVTAKIYRIRRNTGVDIADRPEDPRRDPSVVKKYNTRQLNKYLGELNAFQSRSVGFVAGAGGVVLPRLKWEQYKRLEAQYNALGIKHEAKISDIFLPTAGMTLRQRNAMIHPTAVGEVVNRPYSYVERSSSQVPDVAALEALTRDMRRKVSKSFLPGEIKKARSELNTMLKTTGNDEFAKRAAALSDAQFDTLWNYTNFATLVSLSYEMAKLRAANAKERWHDSTVEDASDDIGELFDWASNLGEAVNNVKTNKKRPSQAKQRAATKRLNAEEPGINSQAKRDKKN